MQLLDIRPLGKRLLIKLNKVDERKSAGGLIISSDHRELIRTAEIISAGSDCEQLFASGDTVIVPYNVGTMIDLFELEVPDDTIRIVTENEIMAKILPEL